MDYDWFWVMLALGVFIPASMVPLAMARDACRWLREYRTSAVRARSRDPT